MSQRSWVDEELVQNVVMDEELVQKIMMNEESVQICVMDEKSVQICVMDEKSVKNFVMGAYIDPKVVMDLSTFKFGGWNILQPSDRKFSDEGIEENDSKLLLIRIPNRDSLFMMHIVRNNFSCDNLKRERIEATT